MEKIFEAKHFFETFTEFYKTSDTGQFPNRLNNRYLALIENNKKIISNSSILDIASHDGRWSFAALKNGASKVIGIEAKENLVKNSHKNMEFYRIPKEKYHFITGNIFNEIQKIQPKTIDVVFCFGIFYHIMNHMLLLTEIKKLQPKYLILDTTVNHSEQPVILIKKEDSKKESSGIQSDFSSDSNIVVGWPSKSALELMLKSLGFEFQYYHWHDMRITNWEHIMDYKNNARVTLVAQNLTDSSKTTEWESLDETSKIMKMENSIEKQKNTIEVLQKSIFAIQNSFTWRTLTKLDKFRTKFYSSK